MTHTALLKWTVRSVTVAVLAGFVPAALAVESEDIIKYRRDVMKANGALMGASAAIIQGKVDYKKSLADHAKGLQAINKDIIALFPKDSDFGETNALESVWSKRAEFEKRAKDTAAKADAFVQAAAGGDKAVTGAKFKELADSCSACHKDFRKKQE